MPDVVLCIIDASNLERNLYVVSQVLELGLPVVVALNMVDLALTKGLTIEVAALQQRLGVPLIPVQANRKQGIEPLQAALAQAVNAPAHPPNSPFPPKFQEEVEQLVTLAPNLPRYLAERLLLDTSGYLLDANIAGVTPALVQTVHEARKRLAAAGCSAPGVEALARYKWVAMILKDLVRRDANRPETWSDRLDRVLTHRVWGLAMFVLIMVTMFVSVLYVAEPFKVLLDDYLFGPAAGLLNRSLADGPLRSLLVKGIIRGVGSVITFLPQIFALFFFIAILEDCGYMARAAYLMDRLMSRVGLNGKSFIPLLSSFACAIPGIMGARVIENPRDRLVTILVAPLMSCSARLPVYTLLIAAFIPKVYLLGFVPLTAVVMVAMYFLGIFAAVTVALVLKRTLLPGKTPPFVMELPMYKVPALSLVLYRMLDRGLSFIYRAGTLILAVSVLVWAAAYYPHSEAAIPAEWREQEQTLAAQLEKVATPSKEAEQLTAKLAHIRQEKEGAWLSDSYLGRVGKTIEPAVKPLGWDWRIGCAAIASFPAREVVVATLGIIFNLGEDVNEESSELRDALHGATWPGTERKLVTIPVALSIMVFFALCAQCFSTLVAIRRETNSWRWPIFTFVYMTVLAYVGAFLTYQLGTWWLG